MPCGVNCAPFCILRHHRISRSGSTGLLGKANLQQIALAIQSAPRQPARRQAAAAPASADNGMHPAAAIAVFQLRAHIGQRLILRAGDLLVQPQPLVLLRHVVSSMRSAMPRLSCVCGALLAPLALHLAHRLLQHRRVQLEADRLDVPALLAAQHVARAAQLQSSAAILKPAPRSLNSFSAASRRRAISVSSCSGGISRYA
jgi:hypothetical protein